MNREIKFRTWDWKSLILLNLYQWEDYDDDFILRKDGLDSRIDDHCWDVKYPMMEYTWLNDEKGKEIYEWDIIYLAWYWDYEAEFPFIELYESSFEWDIWEIKGNIYEWYFNN